MSHSTISAWIEDPSIIIGHDMALKIEQVTGVTIERLISYKQNINYKKKNICFMLREIPKQTIITINSISLPFSQPDKCVIIDWYRCCINFWSSHFKCSCRILYKSFSIRFNITNHKKESSINR